MGLRCVGGEEFVLQRYRRATVFIFGADPVARTMNHVRPEVAEASMASPAQSQHVQIVAADLLGPRDHLV